VNRVFLTTGHDLRDLQYYPAGNPLIGAAYLPYVLGIFAVIGGIGAIISAFLIRSKIRFNQKGNLNLLFF
jgi:uncharacterized membrane protein HdeD (DUF308 family)